MLNAILTRQPTDVRKMKIKTVFKSIILHRRHACFEILHGGIWVKNKSILM